MTALFLLYLIFQIKLTFSQCFCACFSILPLTNNLAFQQSKRQGTISTIPVSLTMFVPMCSALLSKRHCWDQQWVWHHRCGPWQLLCNNHYSYFSHSFQHVWSDSAQQNGHKYSWNDREFWHISSRCNKSDHKEPRDGRRLEET